MAEIRSVGIPSPRVEGEEKVGGKALYAVDFVLPDILWVKVLRSPIAHGKIKRIDITAAQRLPGVKAVLTGQDITGVRIGKKIVDIPLLADGVVRYIGEKVAAVAAETEAAAEQAASGGHAAAPPRLPQGRSAPRPRPCRSPAPPTAH